MPKPDTSKEPKTARSDDEFRLNELARLYPWRMFEQWELQIMTGYGKAVISAACNDPETPCRFGRTRPEHILAWLVKQDLKAQVKEVAS